MVKPNTRNASVASVKTVPALRFSPMKNNAKLRLTGGKGYTFSIPAGHTCPFAHMCKSKADRQSGTLSDGPHTEFRCFAASLEAIYPSLRRMLWNNFEALFACKNVDNLVDTISAAIPRNATLIRVHIHGDFYSQAYFDAWMIVAATHPHIKFYAYTKSLRYWVNSIGNVPNNFALTASYGGRDDEMIHIHNLRYSKVVYSESEAESLGLPIDHDDSHAMNHGPSFALLIHGVQPKGTDAAKAVSALRQSGEFGYGRKADKRREENK